MLQDIAEGVPAQYGALILNDPVVLHLADAFGNMTAVTGPGGGGAIPPALLGAASAQLLGVAGGLDAAYR